MNTFLVHASITNDDGHNIVKNYIVSEPDKGYAVEYALNMFIEELAISENNMTPDRVAQNWYNSVWVPYES